MEYIKLNNDVMIPAVGYGVFQIKNEDTANSVETALGIGYRMIDTAQAYYNEEGVGKGIKNSGVPRQDIFLTSKVWLSNAGEQKATASIDESLRKLNTDYIDLMLIHQHYGDYYGTWRALEKALAAGKVRAIGVSNFDEGRFFDLAKYNSIVPAVNQLQTNVFNQQNKMDKFLSSYNTKIIAWSPLTQGSSDLYSNEILIQIAEETSQSVAKVALRYLLQRGIVVIPKSVRRERMEQNLDLFGFSLSDEQMKRISSLNQHDNGTVAFDDPKFIKWLTDTYS